MPTSSTVLNSAKSGGGSIRNSMLTPRYASRQAARMRSRIWAEAARSPKSRRPST
jgi:hypothetical protein